MQRRPHLLTLLAPMTLLASLLCLAGCQAAPSEPAPEAPWLDRFEPWPEAAEPVVAFTRKGRQTLAADQSHAIVKALSRRQSLVTAPGQGWQRSLDLPSSGTLAWSIISIEEDAPAPQDGTATSAPPADDTEAWIEWHHGASKRDLWRGKATDQWTEEQVSLPTGPGTLRLASDGAVAWAELYSASEPPTANDLPNLVLISLDTVRSDHLSTYGYERPTSPELDRLAEESWVFERSYSASTWTLPSTATLLSGLMPSQHGLRSLKERLPQRVDTLAERLRRRGYRTAAFTDGGFAGLDWGLAQGFERYDVTPGSAWIPKDVAVIVERAGEWLRQNRSAPYFLFLQTYEAHQPYTNLEGFADPFIAAAYAGRFSQGAALPPEEAAGLSEADLQQMVDLYDGEIRRADHYLGRLLDQMRRSPDWQRTAVLVTSDHGEEMMEFGDIDHGYGKVFDPNVRVPLILKPPHNGDGSPVGQRFPMAVSGLDVVPTLLALAGTPAGPEMAGRTLLDDRGRVDPRQAPILIHGTNSFPDADEERLRLDQSEVAVIFDRVRQDTAWYDLRVDADTQHPHHQFDDPAAIAAAQRLQGILAWMHDGTLTARLADDVSAVRIPTDSRMAPIGLWDGWLWHAAPTVTDERIGPWQQSLTPGQPHYLIFAPRTRVAKSGTGWHLEVQQEVGGEPSTDRWTPVALSVDPSQPFTWHPFASDLPPEGSLFPTASSFQPDALQLTDESLNELKALGYLQ